MTLQFQSTISKVITMADRGLRLYVDTQELPPEDIAKIFKLKDVDGIIWTALKEVPLEEKDLDIPEVIDRDTETKTPSQRLRAVLYRYWEQYKTGQDVELFYRRQMDSFINRIKDKLE